VPSFSIALRNDRHELVRLAELVERFGAEHHLADDTLTNINLVLDEVVANVIKYGRAGKDAGEIDVSLALDGGLLTIDVADDGIAFNPLEKDPPDLDLPFSERSIGGLGIHIVRALSETIAYRRENDRNHLTMTMRVGLS
jgi:anti-sigma regulatory factor (Ser/Thr protein kinase)